MFMVDNTIEQAIRCGKAVFKIIGVDIDAKRREVDMVTTFSDYVQKLQSHIYTPLLYKLSFKERIGYLYGCFNYEYNTPRNEVYEVYVRFIGSSEWTLWYTIPPSFDVA